MKAIIKPQYTKNRNRLMLLVLSALTVIAIVSMINKNMLSRQAPVDTAAGYAADFGADLMGVDAVFARQFDVPAEGVIINRVYPNTMADRAGLKREDIIVAINGSVITSVSMFKSLFFTLDFNDTARLTVLRGGQEITLTTSPGSEAHPLKQTLPEGSYKSYISATLIFVAVFSLLFFNVSDRVVIITLGAALMVIVGGYMDYYSQEAVFGSIKINVLALILGLNLITIVLERGGFFEYISNRILVFSNNDVQRIFIVFCLTTYLFSAFVNNLTTIMVLLPVSLALIKNMPIDPKKFLFCEIVASNLGGASTMIGDFPNMLISSEKGVMFHDFIFNMTPITAILLTVMLFYFRDGMQTKETAGSDIKNIIEKAKLKLDTSITDYAAVSRGLVVLALLIVGFMVSDILHIHPSIMAVVGGFALLLFESNPSNIIKDVCFKDIVFFCSLFVLVGGLHAAGILENIAYWLSMAAGENSFLKLVYIIVLTAVCTSFLNAGPSTALFIPIVASMPFAVTSNIIWWALSIGVCIGSSATLAGATAGPVSITIFEKFMGKDDSLTEKEKTITFMEYSKIGLPLMGIFTIVSVIYIGILNFFN